MERFCLKNKQASKQINEQQKDANNNNNKREAGLGV
jgi:hypothetical protein